VFSKRIISIQIFENWIEKRQAAKNQYRQKIISK